MFETNDSGTFLGPTEVDNSRGVRLLLAAIDDDLTQLAAVAVEVTEDARGSDLATWQLVVALAVGLANEMLLHASKENVVAGIKMALLDNAGSEGDDDAR
jgi:hypothetical protein